MSEFRRRLMNVGKGWCLYPVECWGLGNLSSGNYHNYNNLYYGQFPAQSMDLMVKNTTSYRFSVVCYDSNMSKIGEFEASATGTYTLTGGTIYFTGILWDRPAMSVVDNGQFEIYYMGTPYKKPTQKSVMTGADYLWAAGNLNNGNLANAYDNKIVRTFQPIPSGSIVDVDMTSSQYTLKFSLYNSSYSFLGDINCSNGQSYTDTFSSYPTAAYYKLTYWDKPSFIYARTAPFTITFRTS